MQDVKRIDYFQTIFRLGMWWRIFYGVLKFILGLVLLNFVHSTFADIFYKFMNHELIEDPNDVLINAIGLLLNKSTANVSYFIAIYLIFWGFVDSFLSINLLRLRLWSYPVSLALIGLFILYGMYRLTYTHSIVLLIVIIIDLLILWLIIQEYRRLLKSHQNSSTI